jgi:hypothetical protein
MGQFAGIECGLAMIYIFCIFSGGEQYENLHMQYDAIEQPDSEIWLELDETERVDLVIDYHRRIGVRLETPQLHATAHVVAENQVALGDATPVPETLERLMNEGLDRHEAVHAIGSILMRIVFDVVDKPDDGGDINARYNRELALLTAAGWRSQLN